MSKAKLGEEAPANIWTSFLDGCSKRVRNQHGTCVIIGDTQCGKTDLVLKLCADKNLSQQAEEDDEDEDRQKNETSIAQKELLSYDYFYIDDDDDTTDDSRVNVWSFNDHMFEHAFQIVGSDAMRDERFVFLICVDLGNPATALASLHKWLYKAAAYFKSIFAEFPERAEAFKRETVNYIRNAREFKGLGEGLTDDYIELDLDQPLAPPAEGEGEVEGEGEEKKGDEESAEAAVEGSAEEKEEGSAEPIREKTPEERAAEDALRAAETIKYEFIKKYFGMPIVVVGCKSDLIAMDDAESVRSSRELQAKIRAMCLEVGAALVFSSTYIDTNLPTMKKYIEHRLYPENLLLQDQQGELCMEDKINETFIPAGFDTLELIKYSTGLTDEALEPGRFRTTFNAEEIKEIKDTSDHKERPMPATIEIESEQEWLGGLYSFVTQVSGGALLAEVARPVDGASSDIAEAADEAKEEKPAAKKTAPKAALSASSDNVGDFFKNLLSAPPAKK